MRSTCDDPERIVSGAPHSVCVAVGGHRFARVLLPGGTTSLAVERRRNRFVIVIAADDSVDVRTPGPILRREPGLVLIPPGTDPVLLDASHGRSRAVCISSPVWSVPGLPAAPIDDDARPAVPETLLRPLTAFVTAMCSAATGPDGAQTDHAALTGAIEAVADEVVRALVDLFDAPAGTDLHDLATRIIDAEHRRVDLSGDVIAARLGVARRTLQVAFAAHGTTVSHELRLRRIRTAESIRAQHPRLPLSALAQRSGFGSVSSMKRALRVAVPTG